MTEPLDHRWRRLCVWRGLGLGNWLRLLRLGPSFDSSGIPLALSLSFTSPLNSALSLAESLVWSRRVSRVTLHESPIFILGHWRSGTTLLHNLLTLDPQFAFINHYQALFPSHFLLTERITTRLTGWAVPPTRPMDTMASGWRLPQEDETALLILTLFSPYLSVAFSNRPDAYERFADLSRGLSGRELARWKSALLTLLRKVAYQQQRSRFVLKSPTHTSRIPLLTSLFPKARFLYVVRNPYEVYASTIRLRRSMARINGFSRKLPADLEAEVLQDYLKMYHAYHLHRALLDDNQRVELKYEELVADPIRTLERVYHQFDLRGFDEAQRRIESQLPTLRQHRTLTEPLSSDERDRVAAAWAPAFRRYGYAFDDPKRQR